MRFTYDFCVGVRRVLRLMKTVQMPDLGFVAIANLALIAECLEHAVFVYDGAAF